MVKLGFVIVCLGIAMADSENLWIPALIMVVGFTMMRLGEYRK